MAKVAALWRHPIKAHGREAAERVVLTKGQTMPGDRQWAVAHELSEADGSTWAHCASFTRAAKVPEVMAITATMDEATGLLTLSHPQLVDLTFDPDRDGEAFLDWVRPLMPANRAQSVRLVRSQIQGMTDSNYPTLSLINQASSDAVSEVLQQEISMHRWRGNIHITGLEAWAEFDWIGKSLRIGTAEFKIEERIERCMATAANPETGQRDADTLGALNGTFGHQNFGVYAVVTKTGEVAVGDTVEVL
ncbi:MAG: MOSC domain-containing protein [Pseudomonadota bacterium]